ncbi:hypothetical protein GCM10010341_42230 [Streptomyces noursei]|nr:hypothetical protein GCM10010341_42230 [Streptomyces noursei]
MGRGPTVGGPQRQPPQQRAAGDAQGVVRPVRGLAAPHRVEGLEQFDGGPGGGEAERHQQRPPGRRHPAQRRRDPQQDVDQLVPGARGQRPDPGAALDDARVQPPDDARCDLVGEGDPDAQPAGDEEEQGRDGRPSAPADERAPRQQPRRDRRRAEDGHDQGVHRRGHLRGFFARAC